MGESKASALEAVSSDGPGSVAVVASVDPAGRMDVAVRGRPVASAIRREQLGDVLSRVVDQHPGPLDLLIHEADGRDFFGALPASVADAKIGHHVDLLTLDAEGYIPGEDVGIAVIVRLTSATPDGSARGVLALAEAPGGVGDVLLFGLTSGTVHRGGVRY
jgi:hypothetical protein